MPPKRAAPRKAGVKAGGAAGSSAQHGESGSTSVVCSPAAGWASSTMDSPEFAASAMADKAKLQPPPPARRTLQNVLEGSAEGLCMGASASWAHVSTGRGAVKKIPITQETAGPAGDKRPSTATQKGPAAVGRRGVLALSQVASALPAIPTADDQQTQDADGQAAAPQLRFEVSTQYVAWQPPFRVGRMQP